MAVTTIYWKGFGVDFPVAVAVEIEVVIEIEVDVVVN